MICNRNHYWMSPKFFMHFAADGGAGTGDAGASGDIAPGSDGGEGASDGTEGAGNAGDGDNGNDDKSAGQNAEIERLKAEMAKQKAALDKATKEAAESKRQLKARMTQEEIAAKEKEEADAQAAQELDDLRRKVARGETVKSVMGKLGLDEDSAGNLADHLYGAADIDNALLEIQKAWQLKETALRKEYGKITGPGAGADSNSPEAKGVQRAIAIGQQRKAVNEQAQKAMQAYMR